MKSFSRVTLSFATFSAIRQPSVGKFRAKRQGKSYRGGRCCQANSPAQTDNNGIASDRLREETPTTGVHSAGGAEPLFRSLTVDVRKLFRMAGHRIGGAVGSWPWALRRPHVNRC